MTLREIVSDIENIASSGSLPVDFKIDSSQIAFWCNEIRAMLISQAIQKKQDLSDIWIQSITCLDLEQVDASECCELTTGCYLLKTVLPLPITIESWMDNTIIRVVKPNGELIAKSNAFEAVYNKYNKYTGVKSNWYLKNNYLYITNNQLLESITVYGIFEDPSDLSAFIGCSNNTCFGWDSLYPCSLKMANDITNIVLKTKVFPFLQLPTDNKNDGANINEQPNTKGL